LLLYSSYLPLGVPNWTVKNYQHHHASPPVAIPLSGRVPGRASGPSRSRVDDGGRSRCVSGKVIGCLGFSRRRVFIGEGALSEVAEVVSHIGGVARAWAALPCCVAPRGPTPSPLRFSGRFGKFLDVWLLFHPIPRIFPV
jgi:hypothetical protein